MEKWEKSTMKDNPIYIVGLDRSGKTLLRLALSAHPHLALTRRTYMWSRVYQRFGNLANKENFERCFSAMLQQKTIRQFAVDENRIRHEFHQGETSYANLFALFHRQFAEKIGKMRWGEQAGLTEAYAPEIIKAFPFVKIIHMVRDPRNRCEEILNSTPARIRAGKIGALTASWLFSARLALRYQKEYPNHYKVVNYETLLTSPEKTMKEICAFIDEEFVPEMLSLETSNHLGDNEEANLNPQKIWTQDVINFDPGQQKSLQLEEASFIQTHTKNEMELLGYKILKIKIPIYKKLGLVFNWPFNLIRMATWQVFETRLVQ